MKLNKTLETMAQANKEGGSVTIYGKKQLERILHFKDVHFIETRDQYVTIHLENGDIIDAIYSDIIY